MTEYGAIEWFGPDSGKGSVEHVVSGHNDTIYAVRKAARKLATDADFVLRAHRDTGDASIGVIHDMERAEHGPRRLIDSVVYLVASETTTGSEGDKLRAVMSIEKGHYTSGRQHNGEGPRTKADHKAHWVDGVAPLSTAMTKSIRERRMSIK